jgi:hypothetical protein
VLIISTGVSRAFDYPSFSSTSGLNLTGSAAQFGSALRLTPASPGQAGAAWYAQKQYVLGGFDSSFSFRTTNPDGGLGGGDGISFSIQNFSNTSAGSEFGADFNHVSLSFNTFPNGGDEPSGNFVGIVTNQYAAVRYSHTYDLNSTPIRLEDGSIHNALVHYDAAGLDLKLDGIQIFSDVAIPLNQAIDLLGNAWVGFGARTGNAFENQDLISWSFQVVPEPSSAALVGLGLLGFKAFRRKSNMQPRKGINS